MKTFNKIWRFIAIGILCILLIIGIFAVYQGITLLVRDPFVINRSNDENRVYPITTSVSDVIQ